MSVIEKLTEGIVERDLSGEGAALLNKWENTGLLEGLTSSQEKNYMSRLLENQAKELLREASSMAGADVEGFASVAFPIVRRVFGNLIANELVSVQPMSLPSGHIFFLDFVYSPTLNASDSDDNDRLGNLTDKSIWLTLVTVEPLLSRSTVKAVSVSKSLAVLQTLHLPKQTVVSTT